MSTAASFNGTGQLILVPGNASLRPASQVAISAFVRTAATGPGGAEVVSMGDNYALRILPDGNVRFFFYQASSWIWIDTQGVNVLDNQLHHLLGQKTLSALEIYVDGIRMISSPASGLISYSLGNDLMIGRHANGATTFFFNGMIDEVNIYNRALMASEIAALAAPDGTLFSDSFSSAAQWATARGAFVLCNSPSNSYCSTDVTVSTAFVGSGFWSDYSVESSLWVDSVAASSGIKIMGRAADTSNHYQLELLRENGASVWNISKRVGGYLTRLASGSAALNVGTWYRMKLDMRGNVLSAYLWNGSSWTALGTTTDSSFSVGKIGIETWQLTGRFDDVIVRP